ncbi:hypothetical protein NE619_05820 [Anaerovorax odorimutans]|uniref:Uncharacterized protein n=1 Tax=Anaerovorax odorimutans TaxID=109327 RepID=A0ABT1RM27_9FIRM|nr:hypothetical protein [Anaerovorax odorimutans]MCQ4636239.1 hypothetical protein [Anaerovorax odorimutans]
MLKKWIAVFIVFFLGTSALIAVDRSCRESTGCGGKSGMNIIKDENGDVDVSLFGLNFEVDL